MYDIRALINPEQCIGCTRCIKVCPVDAIIGAPKQLHQILEPYCTGCEDCVKACPVDCISMEATQHSPKVIAARQSIGDERTLAVAQRNDPQPSKSTKQATQDTEILKNLSEILSRAKKKRLSLLT